MLIRYPETDDDVIQIHRFLLMVALPAMRCMVNPTKSLMEIIRVSQQEAALMAIVGDKLVGTMGIIKATWWYGDEDFLTDRWHFVLPDLWHGAVNDRLLEEARAIATDSGLEFIHQGKIRERNGRVLMFPRVDPIESSNVVPLKGSA